jgi:uncharacterized protein YndB with AHSA1/START domain
MPATSERLWSACATPAGLQRWQADEVRGEVRQGSNLELSWPDLGVATRVTVERCEAMRALTLRQLPHRVLFELSDGRLAVEQRGLSETAEADGVASGWALALGTLAHQLTHHEDEPRRVVWMVREARCSPEQAHLFFTDPSAHSTWLAPGGAVSGTGIGAPRSRFEMRLADAPDLIGTVVAHVPGRDVALGLERDSWSVLALRTLPLPGDPGRLLLAMQWSRWDGREHPPALLAALEAAMSRLARRLDKTALA